MSLDYSWHCVTSDSAVRKFSHWCCGVLGGGHMGYWRLDSGEQSARQITQLSSLQSKCLPYATSSLALSSILNYSKTQKSFPQSLISVLNVPGRLWTYSLDPPQTVSHLGTLP